MPTAELATRDALRGLKGGAIGLLEAAATPELADEPVIDLIGYALIGQLKGKPCRVMSGVYAMDVARRFSIDPYRKASSYPPHELAAVAGAIAIF